MSNKDQLLYSALHGTVMRYAAELRNLSESITELRDMADGRNDVLAEAAGITAGSWYANPASHVGHELLAAAMLILAGGGHGVRRTIGSWNVGPVSDERAAWHHDAASGERLLTLCECAVDHGLRPVSSCREFGAF